MSRRNVADKPRNMSMEDKRIEEKNDKHDKIEIIMDASQKLSEKSGEDARSVVERDEPLFNEEQLRELILDYRERWLEEDDDRLQ